MLDDADFLLLCRFDLGPDWSVLKEGEKVFGDAAQDDVEVVEPVEGVQRERFLGHLI